MLNVSVKLNNGKEIIIHGASSILSPKNNTVLFVARKMKDKIGNLSGMKECLAFVLDGTDVSNENFQDNKVIFSDNPRRDFGSFLEKNKAEYRGETTFREENHSIISNDANIAPNVKIYPLCYIENDVEIGSGTIIHSGVKILAGTKIGKNCEIHDGVVLGSISMAYEEFQRIPQIGGITMMDRVCVGANSIICRGAINDTIIEDNVRIDNDCSIAHNDIIKKGSMIISGARLFGSVTVGVNAYISGGVTIKNGITIGDSAYIGMGSVVMRDVADNQHVAGNPARVIPV